jgi:hypothetical protein
MSKKSIFLQGKEFLEKDVAIRRIKFKPGYQTIWRGSRSSLQEILELNCTYQKKLTRYLVRFYRLAQLKVDKQITINVSRAILAAKLLPDHVAIEDFNSRKMIYLNGVTISNLDFIVFQGDFIQLTISS